MIPPHPEYLTVSLFQFLTTLLMQKFFLLCNLNLPWCNLKAISSDSVTVYVGEETNIHVATTSF